MGMGQVHVLGAWYDGYPGELLTMVENILKERCPYTFPELKKNNKGRKTKPK